MPYVQDTNLGLTMKICGYEGAEIFLKETF
jgi:hypothetical protein